MHSGPNHIYLDEGDAKIIKDFINEYYTEGKTYDLINKGSFMLAIMNSRFYEVTIKVTPVLKTIDNAYKKNKILVWSNKSYIIKASVKRGSESSRIRATMEHPEYAYMFEHGQVLYTEKDWSANQLSVYRSPDLPTLSQYIKKRYVPGTNKDPLRGPAAMAAIISYSSAILWNIVALKTVYDLDYCITGLSDFSVNENEEKNSIKFSNLVMTSRYSDCPNNFMESKPLEQLLPNKDVPNSLNFLLNLEDKGNAMNYSPFLMIIKAVGQSLPANLDAFQIFMTKKIVQKYTNYKTKGKVQTQTLAQDEIIAKAKSESNELLTLLTETYINEDYLNVADLYTDFSNQVYFLAHSTETTALNGITNADLLKQKVSDNQSVFDYCRNTASFDLFLDDDQFESYLRYMESILLEQEKAEFMANFERTTQAFPSSFRNNELSATRDNSRNSIFKYTDSSYIRSRDNSPPSDQPQSDREESLSPHPRLKAKVAIKNAELDIPMSVYEIESLVWDLKLKPDEIDKKREEMKIVAKQKPCTDEVKILIAWMDYYDELVAKEKK